MRAMFTCIVCQRRTHRLYVKVSTWGFTYCEECWSKRPVAPTTSPYDGQHCEDCYRRLHPPYDGHNWFRTVPPPVPLHIGYEPHDLTRFMDMYHTMPERIVLSDTIYEKVYR